MSVNHTIMPADEETIAEWKSHFSTDKAVKTSDEGMTCTELAEVAGVTACTIRARIRAGMRKGLYKKGIGYRTKSDGTLARVPVYQLIKPESKARRKKT